MSGTESNATVAEQNDGLRESPAPSPEPRESDPQRLLEQLIADEPDEGKRAALRIALRALDGQPPPGQMQINDPPGHESKEFIKVTSRATSPSTPRP